MKTFLNKQMLREFDISILVLQEMLKGVLQAKMKGHWIVNQSYTKK